MLALQGSYSESGVELWLSAASLHVVCDVESRPGFQITRRGLEGLHGARRRLATTIAEVMIRTTAGGPALTQRGAPGSQRGAH